MANAGAFRKGIKKPNQGKRGPSKSSLLAKEAIALFIDGNAERLQGWLDEIAEKEGPKAAFDCFADLLEYHIPKLARTELTGADGDPLSVKIVRFADDTPAK